jgi:dolichol-phosphate mannosyltransferase
LPGRLLGLHRKLRSAWTNFYVHLILGLHVRDVTAGYKLWHRETLNDLDLDAIHSNGYSFQVEMNNRTLTRGHKIIEIPIHFTELVARGRPQEDRSGPGWSPSRTPTGRT